MAKELPKAYEPGKYEDDIYTRWEQSGFFNPDSLEGEPYAIMMPPPNVTGVLHLGHALENTLMDIMARYQRMQGKKVLLVPGTDHAAISTQAKVEGLLVQEGVERPREELGREALVERIRDFAEESKATILTQVKKMGTSADWSRLAYTFDETRSRVVNEMFSKMYKDGLIYRGHRVVNWSVKGQSTCSDDEIVYVDRKGMLYTFQYSKECPIVIATTRPETKLGDTAIAVHPEGRWKQYIGQEFIIENFGQSGHTLTLKVIGDEAVDDAYGTGALGVTTAHSPIDFDMYVRQKAEGNDIGLVQVIGEDGKMTVNAGGDFAGLAVEDARAKMVEWLKENDLLQKEEEVEQNVGTSERYKDLIEAIPKTQWWLDVNKQVPGRDKTLRELMKDAVAAGLGGDETQKVTITPDRFTKMYLDRVNKLRDWCLSRQIWWGHRIPVFYDMSHPKNEDGLIHFGTDTQKGLILESSVREKIDAVGRYAVSADNNGLVYILSFAQAKKLVEWGSVTWEEIKEKAVHFEMKRCEEYRVLVSSEEQIISEIQDPDTLDTWFSSGTWTFSTLLDDSLKEGESFEEWVARSKDLDIFHPTAWMQMGYEILYLWLMRMILTSVYMKKEIPFKDAYIHGMLRDKHGKKFSKSAGNGIDPIEVINEYGTDALRYSLIAGISPGNDAKFYTEKVEGARNLVNKLWNITRFMLLQIGEPNREIAEPEPKTLADKWILWELRGLVSGTNNAFEKYSFSEIGENLRSFTWNELADWYLEIAKVEGGKEEILNYVLNTLLKLWHPYLPFVTEQMWKTVYGEDQFLMTEAYPASPGDSGVADDHLHLFTTTVRGVITGIRALRAENKIEPAKKLTALIAANGDAQGVLDQNAEVIRALARIESLTIGPKFEKTDTMVGFVEGGVEVLIDLEGVVDFEKEKERIAKELEEAKKYAAVLEKKLGNAKFVENAPPEVVDGEKKKLEEVKEKIEKLSK